MGEGVSGSIDVNQANDAGSGSVNVSPAGTSGDINPELRVRYQARARGQIELRMTLARPCCTAGGPTGTLFPSGRRKKGSRQPQPCVLLFRLLRMNSAALLHGWGPPKRAWGPFLEQLFFVRAPGKKVPGGPCLWTATQRHER